MGTNALVKISQKDKTISNIVVCSDGYLDGLGKIILNLLKRKHVNGYTDDQTQYNRVGNFISLLVSKLVIEHTESINRVNEYFKKPKNNDLSCGGCEIVCNDDADGGSYDYEYLIKFNCELHDPKPPTINVISFNFDSGTLDVNYFEKLINDGIPDDEE